MLRPTNNQSGSKGDFLGFEGRTGIIPAVLGFAGVLFTSLLITVRHTPVIPTVLLCMAPGAIAAAVVVFFVSGKPPGYLRDFIITKIGRSKVTFGPSKGPNPFRESE